MVLDTISPLKRIAVFYDGSFFTNVSHFYKYQHVRKSTLSFDGLHEFIRQKVAEKETNGNTSLCQIVEAHFFRGRFSLKSVQALADPKKQLEGDRFYDQLLMHAGIVTHFFPMNENVSPPEEKGIDVWLALEAYDLAVHKRYDVLVLFAGDQDFVPLIRKVNSIGTRVLFISVNITTDGQGNKIPRPIYSSQKLIDEASYTIMLDEEINSKKSKGDNTIDNLFVC
jgi:uncharacterized LabA/DUF88 family protein